MSMIQQSCGLGKKLPILLKKHQKLLLTEEMQKLLIFPWLSEDFAPTNPILSSLPQKKLFFSCNPVSCNSKICCRCMARQCEGAGRTAIAVDARRLINWLSFLMGADNFPSKFWHCFIIFPFFSCGRVSVISVELISIFKNCIF